MGRWSVRWYTNTVRWEFRCTNFDPIRFKNEPGGRRKRVDVSHDRLKKGLSHRVLNCRRIYTVGCTIATCCSLSTRPRLLLRLPLFVLFTVDHIRARSTTVCVLSTVDAGTCYSYQIIQESLLI